MSTDRPTNLGGSAASAPDTQEAGAVFDLGYQPYVGERLGRSGALKAMVKDGLRRSFGIRRKARAKVYPWILASIALLPAIVFVAIAFVFSTFSADAESPFGGHAQYIGLVGTMVALFVASAAPGLLVPDREDGVLAVYSSRPVTSRDYMLGRVSALVLITSTFLIVPNLVMYFGFAALDSRGFGSALISNIDDWNKILVSTLAYVIGYGAPALLVATYAKRIGPAAGTYLAVMFLSPAFAEAFQVLDLDFAKYGTLISLWQHPEVIRDWAFGESQGGIAMVDAGFAAWHSALIIATIAIATAYLMTRRYRREL